MIDVPWSSDKRNKLFVRHFSYLWDEWFFDVDHSIQLIVDFLLIQSDFLVGVFD